VVRTPDGLAPLTPLALIGLRGVCSSAHAAWSPWPCLVRHMGKSAAAGATVFVVEDSRLSASPDVRLRLIWERLGNVPP
jgi:hypothetical protein